MPKPTTKEQLLDEIRREREALEDFLSTLTPGQMTKPGAIGPWSVKDVLAHLVEWEQMFLGWHNDGLRGRAPYLPAGGFNWGQLPQLNQHIYEKHRDRPLDDVRKQFRASYRKMLKTVQGLSEEDLFTPGRFAWTKKLALTSYLIPNTISHYRWARTQMRKGLKAGK
jgi:uncharacterized protein (TIGR03083 family)